MLNNFMKRTLVVFIGAPLLIFLPFTNTLYFSTFTALISFISSWELGRFFLNKGIKPLKVTMYMSAFCSLIVQSFGVGYLFHYLLLCFVLILLVELFRNRKNPINNIAGNMFNLIYTGVFFALLVSLLQNYGPYMIIFLYAAIWCTDIFAYLGGMTCYKFFSTHKLFVRVSPKKTIEGAVSGFIGALIVVYSLFKVLEPNIAELEWKQVLIVTVLAGIFGQIGDLVESLLKRDCEIKDSSQIIPGHGGILDRFDSLLFITPLVFLIMELFG